MSKSFSFPNVGTCSKQTNIVLNDDYAQHPAELKASILSVKELYAGR